MLESLIAPSAEITSGFGSIVVTRIDGLRFAGRLVASEAEVIHLDTGDVAPLVIARDEIASQSEAVSGMPALGLVLEPRALRDVITYVVSADEDS